MSNGSFFTNMRGVLSTTNGDVTVLVVLAVGDRILDSTDDLTRLHEIPDEKVRDVVEGVETGQQQYKVRVTNLALTVMFRLLERGDLESEVSSIPAHIVEALRTEYTRDPGAAYYTLVPVE